MMAGRKTMNTKQKLTLVLSSLWSSKNGILNILSTQCITESSLYIFFKISRSTLQVPYIEVGDIKRKMSVPIGVFDEPKSSIVFTLEKP